MALILGLQMPKLLTGSPTTHIHMYSTGSPLAKFIVWKDPDHRNQYPRADANGKYFT